MASSEVGSNAELNGDGAIAQGDGTTAVGAGGVFVGGANFGNISAGTHTNINFEGDFVAGNKIFDFTPQIPHQIGEPQKHFYGRGEKINEAIENIRKGKVVSITGLGGIGKTEFAKVIAKQLKDDYPDGQIFVTLGTYTTNSRTVEEARDEILSIFSPSTKFSDSENARWGTYYSSLNNKKAFIVFDDVNQNLDLSKLTNIFDCAIVLTSRENLEIGTNINLPELDARDSIQILKGFCSRFVNNEAEDLANLCGHLPLALCVAGGFLKRKVSKPILEYIEDLKINRLQNLKPVEAVFKASWNALSYYEKLAWATLSIMPASFDRQAGLAVLVGIEPPPHKGRRGNQQLIRSSERSEWLDSLTAFNLLKYEVTTQRFDWHDLAREYAFSKLKKSDLSEVRNLYIEHFLKIAKKSEELYLKNKQRPFLAFNLFDQEKNHIETTLRILHDLQSRRRFCEMMNVIAFTMPSLRLRPRRHLYWLDIQLEFARHLSDRTDEVMILGNLGIINRHLGDYENALSWYSQQLDLAKRLRDKRSEGRALGNMANVYSILGKIDKAIVLYEQRLTLARELGLVDSECLVLDHLGVSFGYKKEYSKAVEYLEKALELDRKHGFRENESSALANLGIIKKKQGELQTARKLIEQSLQIAEDLNLVQQIANCLMNLGEVYGEIGEIEKSIRFHLQSLEMMMQIENLDGIEKNLWFIGQHQAILGNIETALELLGSFVAYANRISHHASAEITEHVEFLRNLVNLHQYPANHFSNTKLTRWL